MSNLEGCDFALVRTSIVAAARLLLAHKRVRRRPLLYIHQPTSRQYSTRGPTGAVNMRPPKGTFISHELT